MACEALVFDNVTQAQFDCLYEKARAAGIDFDGNAGSATRDGITVEWGYDPASGALRVQCTGAPTFVPCAMVNARILGLVNGCLV